MTILRSVRKILIRENDKIKLNKLRCMIHYINNEINQLQINFIECVNGKRNEL